MYPLLLNKAVNLSQLFCKQKPNVSHLHPFGCLAYAHLQKDQQPALASHTVQSILIGYPHDYKGWIFWDPATQKEFVSDSTVFWESMFPFCKPGLSSACPPNSLGGVCSPTNLPSFNDAEWHAFVLPQFTPSVMPNNLPHVTPVSLPFLLLHLLFPLFCCPLLWLYICLLHLCRHLHLLHCCLLHYLGTFLSVLVRHPQ